ncbi:MAG: hypothetical protein NVSMB9_26780 [Isosphaeraceae bacterium]
MKPKPTEHWEETPFQPIIEPKDYVPPGLEGLDRLAWLMDRAFRIPGTPIRVGLDALLGLIPVGGDLLTGVVQAGIVLVAVVHYRVPKAIAARMAANVLLDVAVGAVPLLGDGFDVAFKANTRNLKLLSQVQQQRQQNRTVATAPSVLYVAAIAAALIGVLALVLVGLVTVIAWVFRQAR